MKKQMMMMTLAVLGVSAACALAQDEGAPGQEPGRRPPMRGGPAQGEGPGMGMRQMPPPPVIAVLDANGDGVIDEKEIANAPKALAKLDKNGDGKLTRDELRPPMPPRGEGGEGPGFRGPDDEETRGPRAGGRPGRGGPRQGGQGGDRQGPPPQEGGEQ